MDFSDGTLRLIGLCWTLLEGESLLLLEEPELSLHSEIVRKIPSLFQQVVSQRKKQRQIIVSTHSWELLSDKGIGGEEVLLLKPYDEGTKIEVPSKIKEIRSLLESGLSVADAVMSLTAPKDFSSLQTELFK